MDFFSGRPTRQLTVLAQDPTVCLNGKALVSRVPVPHERLEPGPKGHRVHVIDFDATQDRYFEPRTDNLDRDPYEHVTDPDRFVADRYFHAQNVYALVSTTLLQFEAALGRHVTWAFPSGCHHIKVAPHAFADANAYYSRRDEGIVFGYLPGEPPRGRKRAPAHGFVFTCLSADIVVHETTHAILDGLRRELMRPSTPDQPAFHEALADIVALLSTLSRKELIALVLPPAHKGKTLVAMKDLTPEALEESVLFGLAEEFGKTLAQKKLIQFRGNALRRSVELDPKVSGYKTLRAADPEPHTLGEVLVAAVMNAFLAVWGMRVKKGLDPTGSGHADRDRAAEEGAKAAQQLLHMAIRAIDYMPPVNITFRDFLSALLTADSEVVPDDDKYEYRRHLRESFGRYEIEPAEGADPDGLWQPPSQIPKTSLIYGFNGHAEMTWDREAMMRFLWENRMALGLDPDAFTTVVSVRPAVRIGPDGFVLRETVVEYFQLLDIAARDMRRLRLSKPNDMSGAEPVRLTGGGTLIFDDYGRLKFHIGTGVRSKLQNERVAHLWAQGEAAPQMRQEASASRRFERLHRLRAAGGSRPRREEW